MTVNSFENPYVNGVHSIDEINSSSNISGKSTPPLSDMESSPLNFKSTARETEVLKNKILKKNSNSSEPSSLKSRITQFKETAFTKITAEAQKIGRATKKWIRHETGQENITNSTMKRKTVFLNLKEDLKLLFYDFPPMGVKNFISSIQEISEPKTKIINSDQMRDKTYLDHIGDVIHVGLAALVLPIYTSTYVMAAPMVGPIYIAASAFQKAAENFMSAYRQS